jgi:hypothetical protein
MLYELVCVKCGEAFVPSRTDLLLGAAWYRTCPSCRRPPGEGEASTGTDAPASSSTLPPHARIGR